MTLGESAGRTRGNTVRPSARRRMSDEERAKATHPKDDPQQWPDQPVNTVQKISGRILGIILLSAMCTLGVYLVQQYRFPISTLGVFLISLFGYWTPRVVRWETTRRL